MINGSGHVFRAHVGKELPAASRNRGDAGGTRKSLSRAVIAAGAVHGAGPRDDRREALLDAAPDDVFAVAFAPAVGILRIPGAVFPEGSPLVIAVNAGGTDMNIALDAFFHRKLCDSFDAFDVGGSKGFVGCRKIADRPEMKNPVHLPFKQPRQRFGSGEVGGNIFNPQTVEK